MSFAENAQVTQKFTTTEINFIVKKIAVKVKSENCG